MSFRTSRSLRTTARPNQQAVMPVSQVQVKRSESVELGEGDFAIKYNKNGRPVRKSAGQKFSPKPGFVDSSIIDERLLELVNDNLTDPESDAESEMGRGAQKKKKSKKRKRTPSPIPVPLSPLPPLDIGSENGTPEPMSLDSDVPTPSVEPIYLTFNIEKGFSGPLHVQLDASQILRAQKHGHASISGSARAVKSNPAAKSKARNARKKGFLSLPAGKFSPVKYLRKLTVSRTTK